MRYHRKDNAQVLMFCWLLPLLVKIDAVKSEINMGSHSQHITKKQQQLMAPPHRTTCIMQCGRKIFQILFKEKQLLINKIINK